MQQTPLRLVLITTGVRPAARCFADFPGTPVGIIDWKPHSTAGDTDAHAVRGLAYWRRRLRRLLGQCKRYVRAGLQGRTYIDLESLCRRRGLLHARIDTRDVDALERTVRAWRCDLAITSGCSIVPMRALHSLSHGGINLHPSLLPAWRGADPVFWQVQACGQPWGVSVHRLTASVDAGDIVAQREIAYEDNWRRKALWDYLEGDIGVPLLHQAIDALQRDPAAGVSQPDASPTEAAVRPDGQAFADRFALTSLSSRQVWNIACCLGVVPGAWWRSVGVEARGERWVPLIATGRQSDSVPGAAWTPFRVGRFSYLAHPDGRLWFIRRAARRRSMRPAPPAAPGE